MVFNATSNNIIVISWSSDLLVEEIGVPGENHRPVASHKIDAMSASVCTILVHGTVPQNRGGVVIVW
jgi:hypothetical protein